VRERLDTMGFAVLPGVLSDSECGSLAALYAADLFRSVINMERYRFGRGEYKYFRYPLPGLIQRIREDLYRPLASIANHWNSTLGEDLVYPPAHEELLKLCRQHGQERPTPLILRYESRGYNTLHQDLYGSIYFPFQVVLALSAPGTDYQGGEFVMVEQLPRAQSKATVVQLARGDALIFTTNFRPVKGSRGYYRAKMKHGVSEIKAGERFALGVIFHDAE